MLEMCWWQGTVNGVEPLARGHGGHVFDFRNAAAFKGALGECEIDPEKRAELERKLHLRD